MVGRASDESWQMGLYDWTSEQSYTLKCYRQDRRRLQLAEVQKVPFGLSNEHTELTRTSVREQETTVAGHRLWLTHQHD